MSVMWFAPVRTIRCGFVTHGETEQLKPYVLVRGRLEALVNRAVTYDLLALGEAVEIDGEAMYAIRSGGAVFPVMPMAELEVGFEIRVPCVPPGFDAEDFRLRARKPRSRSCVRADPAHLAHGDHVLNRDLISGLVGIKLREAAVLVPVTDDGPDAQVILTRRLWPCASTRVRWRFRAARSIRKTAAPKSPRCARRRRRSGSTAVLSSRWAACRSI
jgi:hypothetical protein